MVELKLNEVIKKFKADPDSVKARLVSHRGFHSVDEELSRPLENTLNAFEQAWQVGTPYCECDIRLTADKALVCVHDPTLNRLSADPTQLEANTPVEELTLEQLLNIKLKDGSHAPTLISVLELCSKFDTGNLVIEIKGYEDGVEIARALAELLSQEQYLSQVAAVIGFNPHAVAEMATHTKEIAHSTSNYSRIPKVMLLTKIKEDETEKVVQTLKDGSFHFPMEDGSIALVVENLIQKYCLDGLYMQIDQPLTDLGVSYVNTDFLQAEAVRAI